MIVTIAKETVKAAGMHFPPLQHTLDAYRRRRRLREVDNYLSAGRLLSAERRSKFRADFSRICLATQLGPAGLLNLEALAGRMIRLNQIGAFVECGTWRGGALAFFALSYLRQGGNPEHCPLYGFDSFEGMPRMTIADGAETSHWLYGRELDGLEPELLNGALSGSKVNLASADDCRRNLCETGYPHSQVTIVPGWFQKMLPVWRMRIGPIAVLRIDGDLYESTRACFETLYQHVIPGGTVIVDDYGTFEGCRRATDEFLSNHAPVEIIPIDVGAVYFVKSACD